MRAEPSPVDSSSSGRSDPLKSEVYPISRPPSDGGQRAIVPARIDQGRFGRADRSGGDCRGGIDLPPEVGDGHYSLRHVAGIYFRTIGQWAEQTASSPGGRSVACSGADARTGGSVELFLLPARDRLRHRVPEVFRRNTRYLG